MLRKFNITKDKDFENIYLISEKDIIIKDLHVEKVHLKNANDYINFPSLRMQEYSQYQRSYLSKKPLTNNDVMDIKMSAYYPYVDAVITEGVQANICRKAKNVIPEMKDLEVYTVKDIRSEK